LDVREWDVESEPVYLYRGFAATITPTAVMRTPPPGSTFSGSSVTFTWTQGAGASAYWLDVGTALGEGNIFDQNVGLVTSQTVNNTHHPPNHFRCSFGRSSI
jgi:hypothetical protein